MFRDFNTDLQSIKGMGGRIGHIIFRAQCENAGLLVKKKLHFQDGNSRTAEKPGTLLSKRPGVAAQVTKPA